MHTHRIELALPTVDNLQEESDKDCHTIISHPLDLDETLLISKNEKVDDQKKARVEINFSLLDTESNNTQVGADYQWLD